jgi:hypothetical protein
MNTVYLPPSFGDAGALLAIIADPEKTAQRLEQLRQEAVKAAQANDEARELAKQAAADRKANEAALAELESAREGHAATLKRIADARLEQREAALAVNERQAADKMKSADAALAEANALKAKWEKRMEKLKAAQASLED